ncbi:MAG: hypothetical protein WA060_02540 [Minisyncoccia bacterium]
MKSSPLPCPALLGRLEPRFSLGLLLSSHLVSFDHSHAGAEDDEANDEQHHETEEDAYCQVKHCRPPLSLSPEQCSPVFGCSVGPEHHVDPKRAGEVHDVLLDIFCFTRGGDPEFKHGTISLLLVFVPPKDGAVEGVCETLSKYLYLLRGCFFNRYPHLNFQNLLYLFFTIFSANSQENVFCGVIHRGGLGVVLYVVYNVNQVGKSGKRVDK